MDPVVHFEVPADDSERHPEAKGAIIVIGVDSVEALMAVVQEAGGTEVMPVM